MSSSAPALIRIPGGSPELLASCWPQEESMHHQYFTEREQLAIVRKLYSMRKAGEVGPFWVEHQGQVLYMDVGRPFEEMRRRISWNEAERIVKGEPWRLVLKVA